MGVLAIFYIKFARSGKDAADAGSYLLACSAGVAAGAGFYFKFGSRGRKSSRAGGAVKIIKRPRPKSFEENEGSSEKLFYGFSLILLLLGLFFFANAHDCRGPSEFIICFGVCLVIFSMLYSNVSEDTSSNNWIGAIILIFLACLMALLLGKFLVVGGDYFELLNGSYVCKAIPK